MRPSPLNAVERAGGFMTGILGMLCYKTREEKILNTNVTSSWCSHAFVIYVFHISNGTSGKPDRKILSQIMIWVNKGMLGSGPLFLIFGRNTPPRRPRSQHGTPPVRPTFSGRAP